MTVFYIALVAVIVLSALAIVYLGLGGRALLGTRERSQTMIGEVMSFGEVDDLWPVTTLPDASIEEFESGSYVVRFVQPVRIDDYLESYATIHARHAGWPISAARRGKRRLLAVNGELESGRGFRAMIRHTG